MKKIISAALLIVSVSFIYLYADHTALVPYRDGDKCGYSDRDAKIVVKPQFDACGDMIDGMASVMKNGKYGFVDRNGSIAIQPVYSSSTGFNKGYAILDKNGKYSVINSRGELVMQSADYEINYYSDGVAVVSKDYKYGLMGKDGKMILPVQYGDIKPAGSSLFIVADAAAAGSFYLGKHTLYNSNGIKVIRESYDLIYPAANGFMMIKNGRSWGYLNPDGAVIAPAIYESVRNIKPDGTACIMSKGMWGIMNGQGKIIVGVQYEDVGGGEGTVAEEMQAKYNYFTVQSGGKWGIVSLTGDTIARTEYFMIGTGNDGYIPAYKELDAKSGGQGKIGLTLLDAKGWELFKPKKEYSAVGEPGDGLLPVGELGAYGRGKVMGYINFQGETAITLVFEEAGRFEGGYAIVKKKGLYGVTNKIGWMVEEAKYDDITRSVNYPGLFEGTLSGKKVFFEPGGKHFWK